MNANPVPDVDAEAAGYGIKLTPIQREWMMQLPRDARVATFKTIVRDMSEGNPKKSTFMPSPKSEFKKGKP